VSVRIGLYNGLYMSAATQSGISLVLGPPNSGKRGLALEWWQERMERRPLVVMPTAPDARDMSAEMARRMGGLVGQAPALTFMGLVEAVVSRSAELVGEFERALLVAEALRSVPLEALGPVAQLPGVSSAAGTLLQELGESGRPAAEVSELLDRWASVDPDAAPLARDVQRLLTAYQGALERLGLTDQPMAVQAAMAAAGGWRRPVAFCGFTSLTRGQRELVQRLSRETEVLVTLNHERESGSGLCAPGEAEWWIERADEIVDVSPRTRAYASAAIAHLERFLLSGEVPSSDPPGQKEGEGVRFLLSSGRRAEAMSVAEQVAQLIRAGFDPGGIAIVVRQVRTWGRLLGDVFASCGIPHQTDASERLGETGLGYAFLQALRAVAADDADALLSFLRSPYAGAAADDVCNLETRYKQGVARGAGVLCVLTDRRTVEALEPVRALVRRLPGTSTQSAFDLAAAGVLVRRMLLAAAKGMAVGRPELEADARAFKALQAALEAMGRSARETEPQMALRLLAQAGVPAPPQTDPGAVQIVSAKRARARRFDAVFVLGLVEGEFPGQPDVPSLLSAGQRIALDLVAGGLLPSDPESDRALFVGAATRAWRLLYLSARDAEDDGGEAVPSRFWSEAKAILGAGQDAHEWRTLADQVFSTGSAPSLRHYRRACAAEGRGIGAGGVATPLWRRVPDRLTAPEVLSELQGLDCFSPSGLESYAGCPFAWFVDRVVGREELETELDGRVLGDLIHGVLSRCYRSLQEDGLLPLTSERVAEAQKRADALIEHEVEGPDCPGSAAERRVAAFKLRNMARRLFQAEAASGGSLVFQTAEVKVGAADGVDVGGLRVRGRIDRIDGTPDGQGRFVLDYKSGSIPSPSAIGTAEGLQLPLYLLALEAEQQGAGVVGGAYVSLSEGTVSGVVNAGHEGLLGARAGKCRSLEEAEWRALADGVLDIAQTAAKGMRAGIIAPKAERLCPAWCDLAPACRSRQGGHRP
jgi:RecB family exonuclease